MWLDDDGDEPIGGEVPDPSTRHWRHPSEVAAEAARAAAAAAPIVPEGASLGVVTSAHGASSTSILWPISVVGGCIAIAALGVVGLYMTGAADIDELQVASATTVGPSGSDLSALNRPVTPAPSNRISDEDDDGDSSETERLDGLGADAPTLPRTTTTLSTASTTSTTTLASTTTTAAPQVLPQQTKTLIGPAIYSSSDAAAEQLASVVLAEGYLLTSASAMGGRADVSLRIGDLWIDALVSHVDMLSDVAVLTPLDSTVPLSMPISVLGPTAKTGIHVFLGYCQSEMASPIELDKQKLDPNEAQEWGTAASAPGCSPVIGDLPTASEAKADAAAKLEGAQEDPATEQDSDPAEDPDSARKSGPESDRESDKKSGNASGKEAGKASVEDPAGDEANDSDSAAVPPAASERQGKIYSLDQTLMTMAGRMVYEPIRTGIPQEPPVAGSPLRDRQGRIVGLVVGAASPNVSAVPIERAIAIAKSMVESGFASPAWSGFEVISTSSGVEVTEVESEGPADGKLQTGDLIDRVNGDVVIEADHLAHLMREAGPGKALVVRFTRDGQRQQAAIKIGSIPTE